LVVGDQVINQLAGHEKSSKHRKAEELIAKGQPIRILGESDFRELLAFVPRLENTVKTEETAMAVLNCGDVIALSGNKEIGTRLREAVQSSNVPLHLLDRRFSTYARIVVEPDPSMQTGFARQAAAAGVPVLSEQEALDAIVLLNTSIVPGWCDCAAQVAPSIKVRTWEDHLFGTCGWPGRRCDRQEHRKTWCRACHRFLRVRFCDCNSASEFSHDQDRNWWIHPVCGWPKRAWFLSSGAIIPDSADGTPSWTRRIHEARSVAEISIRPLPDVVRATDLRWDGRFVDD
jgi:hypothetical protein